MKTTDRPRLGIDGISPEALLEKGRTHVARCAALPWLDLPPTFLPEMAAACNALEQANLKVLANGGRRDRLERNTRRTELEGMIRQLMGQVSARCDRDAVKIAATGFELRRPDDPIGLPTAPAHLRARPGILPGELHVCWRGVKGRRLYTLHIHEGDPTDADGWTVLTQTSKNTFTAAGLQTDRVYHLRVSAVGTAGEGPLSDVAAAKAA